MKPVHGWLPVLFVTLLASSTAHAQSAEARENAQALYKAGNDARDAGDLKSAAERYAAAFALAQTPVIAVAFAKAESGLGQLIEARQSALGVARIPVKPHESALTTTARAQAAALAEELEAKIPTVSVTLATHPGRTAPTVTVTVTVDGEPAPNVALDLPLRLNPGRHVAVAKVGESQRQTTFELAEAERREVTLDYPEPPLGPSPTALPVIEPVARAEPLLVPLPPPQASGARVAGYTALAAGGAGVVITAIFGAFALRDHSSLESTCGAQPLQCPSSSESTIRALHTSALVSDVALGVAIAGLGAGTVLVIRSSPAHAGGAQPVTAYVGVGHFGVRGGF